MSLSIRSLPFTFTTGGRHEAGYKGYTNDCVIRAIVVMTERPYKEIYKLVHNHMKANPMYKQRYDKKYCSPRFGVYQEQTEAIMKQLGYKYVSVKNLVPNSGQGVSSLTSILPKHCIIRVIGHLVAYKEGVLFDTGSPTNLRRHIVQGVFVREDAA